MNKKAAGIIIVKYYNPLRSKEFKTYNNQTI